MRHLKKIALITILALLVMACASCFVACDESEPPINDGLPSLVEDVARNERLLDELEGKLAPFAGNVANTNHYDVSISVEGAGTRVGGRVRLQLDPLYIDVSGALFLQNDNGVLYPNVLQEEEGKIISYQYLGDNRVNREYVCDKQNFNIMSNLPDMDINLDVGEIDAAKINVTKQNDTYTISAYYRDLMSDEDKVAITSQFAGLEIDFTPLWNSVMTMKFMVGENFVNMKSIVDATLTYMDIPISMASTTTVVISAKEFEKKNYNTDEFDVSKPDSIEEVTFDTDISSTITLDGFEVAYIRVELEKGTYTIERQNYYSSIDDDCLVVALHDSNGVQIGEIMYGADDKTFTIESDGKYYLGLSVHTSEDAILKIDKIA